MKTTLLVLLGLSAIVNASSSLAPDSRVFELRTSHAAPGKVEARHSRFRDHTNAIFKKLGMEVVGYWVPMDADKGSADTLVYVLAFKDRAAATAAWAAFRLDPDWVKARTESEKDGSLTTKVESVFMTATDYSPLK